MFPDDWNYDCSDCYKIDNTDGYDDKYCLWNVTGDEHTIYLKDEDLNSMLSGKVCFAYKNILSSNYSAYTYLRISTNGCEGSIIQIQTDTTSNISIWSLYSNIGGSYDVGYNGNEWAKLCVSWVDDGVKKTFYVYYNDRLVTEFIDTNSSDIGAKLMWCISDVYSKIDKIQVYKP